MVLVFSENKISITGKRMKESALGENVGSNLLNTHVSSIRRATLNSWQSLAT